jgi:RimJ/RimL family protein N-acetyltransferase
MLSDLEFLALEIDTLWARDDRGRLVRRAPSDAPPPYLVLAAASDGHVAAVGAHVPDLVAAELLLPQRNATARGARWEPAGFNTAISRITAVIGPVEVTSGPSYVATEPPVTRSSPSLIVSDGRRPCPEPLQPPPDAGWTRDEWRALLAGDLGPWAMARAEDSIASICFCARLTGRAAEAGLRTEPAHRRRGLGSAVTAAWASLVLETGRTPFYSTSAENRASQAVAASLTLRPIGWIWQVAAPRNERPPT